jgi:hypothetical protein
LQSWGKARLNEDTSLTFDFKNSQSSVPVYVVMMRKKAGHFVPYIQFAEEHNGNANHSLGTVGGKRRIFNFFESAPIKAFASL